jgi:hypothetical protein
MVTEFNIGDKVRIMSSKFNSINKVGDIGIITEMEFGSYNELDYKVTVEGRKFRGKVDLCNWHSEYELELVGE